MGKVSRRGCLAFSADSPARGRKAANRGRVSRPRGGIDPASRHI